MKYEKKINMLKPSIWSIYSQLIGTVNTGRLNAPVTLTHTDTWQLTDLFDDAGEELLLKGVEGDSEVDECHLDADGWQVVRVAEGRRQVQSGMEKHTTWDIVTVFFNVKEFVKEYLK